MDRLRAQQVAPKGRKDFNDMRNADRFEIASTEPKVNIKVVKARVKGVAGKVYREESPEILRTSGIDVFCRPTRFLDSFTIKPAATR